MKYNRQQKYNCWSAVKTTLLIMLMIVSVLLCYSYLKLRQKNMAILETIEQRKTQISDLEAITHSNKELIKNLKNNVDKQKTSLRKLSDNLSSIRINVEPEKSYQIVKQMHKEMKEKYENLNKKLNEEMQAEQQKREKEKELRITRIRELKNEIDKLRDAIADLKKSNQGNNKTNLLKPEDVNLNKSADQQNKPKSSREKPIINEIIGNSNNNNNNVNNLK